MRRNDAGLHGGRHGFDVGGQVVIDVVVLHAGTDLAHHALQAEFDRIEANVRVIRVPTYYANQLYDLRGHVELVRQRLAQRPGALRMAAE